MWALRAASGVHTRTPWLRGLAARWKPTATFCSPTDEPDITDSEEVQNEQLSSLKSATDMNYFGLYKAVLVGQVGFGPFEKILGDGRALILFSVGTSGLIRPKSFPEHMQWHKVAVYPERLRGIAKRLTKGRRVYVEGNLEMRIFNDPVTGAVKRVREISVRQNGQLIVMQEKERPSQLMIGSNKRKLPPTFTNSPLDPCQEDDTYTGGKLLPSILE